ncbi:MULTISPECIES: helix-turn-helix domain-containing protein [unclassified Proteiniphilum]|uniref:helix-turn-helix domain-containing protein n=1 Tax=unclassified Proteiniphilum TaxID=2622718 RepID=UPI0025F8CF93|nr:helix-turn-helix domain-containing protein [Proteiniphilum sp. UBA5384]
MNKGRYGRISLEDVSRQAPITGVKNFILSDNGARIKDYSFDFQHPNIIEDIALAICVRGNARVKINLQEYHIEPNMIITLLPNYLLEICDYSDDWLVEFIFISFDFVSDFKLIAETDLFEQIGKITCLKIKEEEMLNLLDFHAFIVKKYKREDHLYREEITKSLLHTLVYEVLQLLNTYEITQNGKALSRSEKHLTHFIGLLFQFHRQERSIKFYADKMFLTPKYLSKIIREVSGKSVSQWIDEMVIMEAKAMLKSSNLTVLQISEKLNFPNASFFGSYFKKRTGISPIQYRESG